MSKEEKPEKRKRSIKKENPEQKRIKQESGSKESKLTTSLFYSEEAEVDTRSPEKDVEVFKSTCSDIRQTMLDIKSLKDKKASHDELEDKRVSVMLDFMNLKKLNRLAHIRCKKVREQTNDAKQRIDHYHLQLQNLLYEIMHLEKEITKCLEFKSKDEEIELVTLDDFYKTAPSDISRTDTTKTDPHLQRLARLEWELEQRKQLAKKLKDSKQSKEGLAQEIKNKQEYLENLQPKLKTVLEATKPVQEYLDMPFDQIREQQETARHLPPPLYVLYMQTSAYRQACDKDLQVSIIGDLDAAKAIKSSGKVVEEDSDSDQEEQEHTKKSKRRRKTVDSRVQERKQQALKKHPLAVKLDINCKDGNSLHLTFNFLITLEIITVNIGLTLAESNISSISGSDLLAPESVLTDLYPGDHGKTSPNPANKYELRKLGLKDFTSYITEVGWPYLWAQWLGGLQFLENNAVNTPEEDVSFAHMQQTIRRLKQRVRSRLCLMKQTAAFVQELKDLRKSIEELKRSSETREKTTLFRIEDQGFHKTYFQYLKGLFCSFPWLDIENEDFKREVKELVGENPCKFRSMCSFASQKFTQMRNQLRRMLFHSTMDIQALSLDGLCNYLYRPFTPPGESPVDKKRRKMTVALRAFLSTKKFNECEKFWPEFKETGNVVVDPEYQGLFPSKIVSRLTSWKRSTYEDFAILPHTQTLVDDEVVEQSDIFFTAVIERGSAKMTAQIVMTHDYPKVAPVFVVSVLWQHERTAANDKHIKEMEEEVNVHHEELMNSKSCDTVLSNQMQRLLMCFDIYLETEAAGSEEEGPMEISKEKIYNRMLRGPSRSKPYRYCPDIGIFTHR